MKYQLLIIPSSDEEREFEEAGTCSEAFEIHKREGYGSIHQFDTEEERDQFIKGYEAGVGYLGNGAWYKLTSNEPREVTEYLCPNCGSNEIRIDAWAEWDVTNQEYVLHSTFDDCFCDNCEENGITPKEKTIVLES